EGMLQHAPRIVAAVAARIGRPRGEVTPYTCRHTYCAARLQTLDHGAPVSPFTVRRELGHRAHALVRKAHGHFGTARHQGAALQEVPHRICYSLMANGNGGVRKVLKALGAGADTVSVGELRRALAAGFDAASIVFSGVGKTAAELEEAIRVGVGFVNIESSAE